ncbi:MAG: flavodoxin domain-containing protein [Hyphomicrobiaceae bacterium]
MRTLLIYGTVEGQTQKIASEAARLLQRNAIDVVVLDANETTSNVSIEDFDACIVAASVHQQRYSEAVNNFVRAHVQELNARPSAFISVSLVASFPEGGGEAQSYVDRLLERSGWLPAMTHNAAGALRYTKYDFFQEQIIRHVVLKDREIDALEGEHEFTDWSALETFVDAFKKLLAR